MSREGRDQGRVLSAAPRVGSVGSRSHLFALSSQFFRTRPRPRV